MRSEQKIHTEPDKIRDVMCTFELFFNPLVYKSVILEYLIEA
jgi:hypothetical protein